MLIMLKSGDMNELALAYALTIHKMQGSQSKYIIGAIGTELKDSTFINRNMLYTMVTRAEECVYLIGSVEDGMTSVLNNGRKIASGSRTHTLVSSGLSLG